jgi:hypothetical protein
MMSRSILRVVALQLGEKLEELTLTANLWLYSEHSGKGLLPKKEANNSNASRLRTSSRAQSTESQYNSRSGVKNDKGDAVKKAREKSLPQGKAGIVTDITARYDNEL